MNHLEHIAAHLGELDAMLLTGESNCYYATGFMGEGVALVTRKGSWYFTDSRYTEAAGKAIGDAAVIWETSRANPFTDLINKALAESGAQKVGFEEEVMTVATHTAYTEKLHCTLVPATAAMTALRGSKDDEEIANMIAAQRIAEGALAQICKEIHVGMTEKEIAARLNYLMVSAGAEKTSFDTIIASGPNGSMPHAVPSMRQVQQGDFITMDFGCVYKGYCSDITRTFAFGDPGNDFKDVYEAVLQANYKGIEAVRAGVKASDIDKAARDYLKSKGLDNYFTHSTGHGVGVEIHEHPFENSTSETVLKKNMVVTVEPGVYMEGLYGVRVEDLIIVENDGCNVISRLDKKLLIL